MTASVPPKGFCRAWLSHGAPTMESVRCPICGDTWNRLRNALLFIALFDLTPCGCLPDAHIYNDALDFMKAELLTEVREYVGKAIRFRNYGIDGQAVDYSPSFTEQFERTVKLLTDTEEKRLAGNASAWRK